MFKHAKMECLCDADLCTLCCSAVGWGKDEPMLKSGGEGLNEDRKEKKEKYGTEL